VVSNFRQTCLNVGFLCVLFCSWSWCEMHGQSEQDNSFCADIVDYDFEFQVLYAKYSNIVGSLGFWIKRFWYTLLILEQPHNCHWSDETKAICFIQIFLFIVVSLSFQLTPWKLQEIKHIRNMHLQVSRASCQCPMICKWMSQQKYDKSNQHHEKHITSCT